MSSFFLCIKYLPYCYSVRSYYYELDLDWSFLEHLSRALPTEMIFCQLRSINSYRLIPDLSAELMLDMVEIIVRWLQVSVSKCSRQTPHTKNLTCVQGLGSERPSDLYDRFQRELLLHQKKVLSQR